MNTYLNIYLYTHSYFNSILFGTLGLLIIFAMKIRGNLLCIKNR